MTASTRLSGGTSHSLALVFDAVQQKRCELDALQVAEEAPCMCREFGCLKSRLSRGLGLRFLAHCWDLEDAFTSFWLQQSYSKPRAWLTLSALDHFFFSGGSEESSHG